MWYVFPFLSYGGGVWVALGSCQAGEQCLIYLNRMMMHGLTNIGLNMSRKMTSGWVS